MHRKFNYKPQHRYDLSSRKHNLTDNEQAVLDCVQNMPATAESTVAEICLFTDMSIEEVGTIVSDLIRRNLLAKNRHGTIELY